MKRMNSNTRLEHLQAQVKIFNQHFPIGTDCELHKPDGSRVITQIRLTAALLGHTPTPVVWLDCDPCAWHIDLVKKVSKAGAS